VNTAKIDVTVDLLCQLCASSRLRHAALTALLDCYNITFPTVSLFYFLFFFGSLDELFLLSWLLWLLCCGPACLTAVSCRLVTLPSGTDLWNFLGIVKVYIGKTVI